MKKNRKVKFYECEPESTFSPLNGLNDLEENIIIHGNDKYITKTTDLFDFVSDVLSSGYYVSMLDDFRSGIETLYTSEKDITQDYFGLNIDTYSEEELEKIEALSREYLTCRSSQKDNIVCKILSIIEKRKWRYVEINGATQREWQRVYYVADDWDNTALQNLEIEYFNMGAEYIDEDEQYRIYVHNTWSTELIKIEISECTGIDVDDIVLYKIVGYQRITRYEEI